MSRARMSTTVRADMAVPRISDAAIDRAAEAGRGTVIHTPIAGSAALSDRCGGTIVLKAENLQRTGSFKIRGAMSKLVALGELGGGDADLDGPGSPDA